MRGSGSVVERCLAKANVASSNLVFRSNFEIALVENAIFLFSKSDICGDSQNTAKFLGKGTNKRSMSLCGCKANPKCSL